MLQNYYNLLTQMCFNKITRFYMCINLVEIISNKFFVCLKMRAGKYYKEYEMAETHSPAFLHLPFFTFRLNYIHI